MRLLRDSLFGVDISLTVMAFSLYLAYLDQLSPRDIQALQREQGASHLLPRTKGAQPAMEHSSDFFRSG